MKKYLNNKKEIGAVEVFWKYIQKLSDDPPMDPYTKDEARVMALAERLRRKEERKEKRRSRQNA